jgi:EAL domain-containing protein (putative c-di-GMP-specific phosphodiesterase class I)/CHASE2 domain-containing sensor protein/GGDEF domain-containing protein
MTLARSVVPLARRAFGSGLLWVALAIGLAMAAGVLRPVEDAFSALRFSALRHQPSQQLTVVEIDTPSLRAAGRWPWSRDRFATAIANLQAAGATVVAFDVDFSVQSSADADRHMAQVIGAHPGSVILPTFVQAVGRSDQASKLVETFPLADLSAQALVASVNIPIDADGRARRYQYGFGRDENYRQSMGAALANLSGQREGTFLIDYSVSPFDIARLSFEDVYRNRFDVSKVRGRKILIGARALELGDAFSTPQFGTVNGVYIHALAFEALLAGRGLMAPQTLLVFAAALGLAFFLRPRRKATTLRALSERHAMVGAGLLVVPVVLQAFVPVSLPVGPMLFAQGLCLMWATRAELDRRARAIMAERESGLLHLAMHEPETELPNRRALLVDIATKTEAPDAGVVAVLAVGIDRYAAMRGAVGYSLFSQIVREVAARLALTCPDSQVAHLSTSVLGLAVSGPDRQALDQAIARLEALDSGYLVAGHAVDAHVKVGVAYAGQAGEDAERLLENATLALDEARRLDQAVFAFDAAGAPDVHVNLALMSEMRRGLHEGQFSMHYQPKLTTADGSIRGVEALIRWKHPVHGNMPPDSFIVVAEETGNIRELTLWTLHRARDDAARFRRSGRDLLVSVNISGRLLADQAFCEQVLALVKDREHDLCLEITETASIANTAAARACIAAFRGAGLKISIDDYGVGLSSLSYLKMIDANELKVDKSLVVSVAESRRDRMILKSTIDLAHSLGMVVVAEGVETEEVRAVIAALGCDMIQGYLISKPLPCADLETFLDGWACDIPLAATA